MSPGEVVLLVCGGIAGVLGLTFLFALAAIYVDHRHELWPTKWPWSSID